MTITPETRTFLDRLAEGAVDTIETIRMEDGNESILTSEAGRMAGKYIAIGTLAHLFGLSEQAGANDEMQTVINRINAMFTPGGAA